MEHINLQRNNQYKQYQGLTGHSSPQIVNTKSPQNSQMGPWVTSLDYVLPIKNGYIMGRGGPVPWGRRHWIGINFCHPEVVKLQQQCQMQNSIFDLPHNWFYSFFSGREGECQYICQYILETETGELEGKLKMTIQ